MAARNSSKTHAKKSVKAARAPAKSARQPAKSLGKVAKLTKPSTLSARAKQSKPGAKPKAAKSSPTTATPLPLRSVTPMLVIDGASNAIAWYKQAFGAKELQRNALPNGRLMHAAIQVGDSIIMMSDSFGPAPTKMAGVTLHVQQSNINDLWAKALAGGAVVEMPLADQFWGDRYGQLRDPFGHSWSFGWPAKMTPAQKEKLRLEAMVMFGSGEHAR